jgi:hypothetical protein
VSPPGDGCLRDAGTCQNDATTWAVDAANVSSDSVTNSLPRELGVEYICWRTLTELRSVRRVCSADRDNAGTDHLGESARCGITAIREGVGLTGVPVSPWLE